MSHRRDAETDMLTLFAWLRDLLAASLDARAAGVTGRNGDADSS